MNGLEFSFDKPTLRRAWGVIDGHFGALGLTLRRGSDFDEIEDMAATGGLRPLEGHFTPSLNTYTPSQAFWLGLVDARGKLVGRVCARFDPMEYPMVLTDFWRKYFHRCYPNAEGGQVALAAAQPRVGRRISGNLVYIGGTEIDAAWQGRKLGGLLNQIVQIEALDEWRANFYYGWVQGHNFKDAFWRDCGFTRAYFHAIRWDEPLPDTLDANLILVGNSADDVCDLIERIADAPPAGSSSKTIVENRRPSGSSK